MEVSRCPAEGCGAPIGGQSHVAVKGVTRLGSGVEIGDSTCTRGYVPDATRTEKGYDIPGGISKLTVQFLRLIMHLSMRMALRLRKTGVANLIFPLTSSINLHRATSELQLRLELDWKSLRASTALDDKDLAMAMHMVIAAMRSRVTLPPSSMTVALR